MRLVEDGRNYAPAREELLKIAELAVPLAKYLSENLIIGEVIVSMNSVALRYEGFAAQYFRDYTEVGPPN